MQEKNKKYQIILLLIISIIYSCRLDKKREDNLNKIEEKTIIDNDVVYPEKIDSLINNGYPYVKREFSLNDYSSEGGIVQSYSDKNGYLAKIKATYFGHSGKSEWSYYFKSDSLFFVDKKEYRYENPIFKDANVIIDTIMQSEYFLQKGNLRKWIDENNSIVDSTSAKFEQESDYLKQDVKEFRQKIKAISR